MSFKHCSNRHDAWINYRNRHQIVVAEIGLPADLLEHEHPFTEFLTIGRIEGIAADIESLSEEQFSKLFHFVTSWFDFDAANFTAFETRRMRG